MCSHVCVHIHVSWRRSLEPVASNQVKKVIKGLIMECLYAILRNFNFFLNALMSLTMILSKRVVESYLYCLHYILRLHPSLYYMPTPNRLKDMGKKRSKS